MFSDLFQLAMVVGVYGVLLCDLRSVAASDGCLCIWSVAVCFQICCNECWLWVYMECCCVFWGTLQRVLVVGVYGVLLCVFRLVATSGCCVCVRSVSVL